eukprot:PITA_12158
MEASAGLVAGSHNRKEFVVIHEHEEVGNLYKTLVFRRHSEAFEHIEWPRLLDLWEDVGLNTDGELFVACNDCGFPVCRSCYQYERQEGNQSCPQCNNRYKRQKGYFLLWNSLKFYVEFGRSRQLCSIGSGSPRVEGDDDEEDVDDIEHEFNVETH